MADVIDFEKERLEKAKRAVVAASDASENPFSLLTFDQLWIDRKEDESWVCKELEIGPGRPCGLWGFGGCGKTYVAIALCVATVTGRLLFGRFQVDPGPAVYLSHEMGRSACVERLRRIANGMLCEPIELVDLSVGIYPKVKLNSPEARAAYTKLCTGKKLCVIDSLRRALPGEDENKSEIAQYLHLLAEVSDATGCTFLVLHHSPKDGPNADAQGLETDDRTMGRGSGAILDGSGSVWLMKGSGKRPRTLKQIRAHDNADGKPDPIRIDLVQPSMPDPLFDTHGPPVRYDVLEEQAQPEVSAFDRIKATTLRFVSENPGMNGKGIESRVGGKATTVRTALDELEAEGLVQGRPGPKNSTLYYPA